MERQKKIVDASVALKWFLKEENSDKAEKLLKAHIESEILLVIPELFFYEVINGLRYKKTTFENIRKAVIELFNLQLHCESISENLMIRIAEISLWHNLTVYDATYVCLAEKMNAKLITTDDKILLSKHPLVECL